ncbi:MAG: DUF3048 domain-containing protein [bacterium]
MQEEEKKSKRHFRFRDPRLLLVVVLILGVVFAWITIGSVLVTYLPWGENSLLAGVRLKAKTTPSVSYRLLDGEPLPAGSAQPYPVGVMIENLAQVRPQAGLADASIVYETLAEGGATRFLALFEGPGDHLEKIGPVRSARPYYLEWNSEVDALHAHAGGSPEALQEISGFSIKDLNGIAHGAKYFFRDHTIAAPHNLFTSSDLLTRALADIGLAAATPTFTSWQYKDDPPIAARPADGAYAKADFSGRTYAVEYRYARATNDYARLNAGVPHTDALTGQQIHVKNVILQIIPKILDVGEKGRLTLDVTGTGKALLFIDGGANVGTWSKKDRTSRTDFFFEDGKPAVFTRGSTWVEVTPEDEGVSYGTQQ